MRTLATRAISVRTISIEAILIWTIPARPLSIQAHVTGTVTLALRMSPVAATALRTVAGGPAARSRLLLSRLIRIAPGVRRRPFRIGTA